MSESVAFIGLGVMGAPMAGHLADAGLDVCVYNRTRSKADVWRQRHAGRVATSARQSVDGASLVISCVGNDTDLRSIAYGDEGVLAALSVDSVWVDHTTASAEVARELAEAAQKRGARFLDAPVSGGEAGAQAGQLSVMVGGEDATLARVAPVLHRYSKRVVHIGPNGHGQLAKMVNQICIAGLLQALSEGLRFGERAGLDMGKTLEAVSHGAAQSWQMDHRAATMLERRFDFGFAVDWMSKDLGLCLDQARRNDLRLELTAAVLERYEQLRARGSGRWDTSSLIALLD